MWYYSFIKNLLVIVIFSLPAKALAQDKICVSLNIIGLKQNISSTNIHKIIEDKNGFIWFSTQDGLNKYDGINVTKFTGTNIDTRKKLLGSDCFAMDYRMNDDLIYVSSSYEGINVIDINKNIIVNRISTADIIKSKEPTWIKTMLRFNEYLILTTYNNNIIYFNTRTLKAELNKLVIDPSKGLIQKVFIQKNELIVLISQFGIKKYDLKSLELKNNYLFENTALEKTTINDALFVNDEMSVATSNGLFFVAILKEKLVIKKRKIENSNSNISESHVSSLYYSDSNLILSTLENTYKYDIVNNKLDEFYTNSEEHKKFLKATNCITKIKNSIWLGGMYGVAQIKSLTPFFTPFYRDSYSNKKIEHIYTLKKEKENIFIAAEDGFYKADLKKISFQQIIKDQSIYNFGQISTSHYLISGTKELLIYDGLNVYAATKKYPELKALEKDLFISIQKINDSIILLASQLQTGLFKWNIKNHSLKNIENNKSIKIEDKAINRIWHKSLDSTFIISETEIQLITNQTSRKVFTKKELLNEKADLFMDMCETKNNYWIAAYGLGIIKLDKKFNQIQIIGTKTGLNNSGLYRIFNIGDSIIVASTNNGLSIYNVLKNKVTNYFEEDGLHSSIFEETSGYKTDKEILIGGISGFSIFNFENYKTNSLAPVFYFKNIRISTQNKYSDSTNLFFSSYKIPSNATQTKISFIGLNFQNSNRVTYKYKISGLHNDWIPLETQNFVDLIGIPHGTYHLQVKAANEDGVECEPKELILEFLPKWYQTWWFKILVALSLIAIGFALYKMRVAQIIKEQKIKNALASDLHDELGSSLTGLKVYAYQAKKNPEYMESLQEGITQSIKQVREMIWQLNEEKLTVNDLINKLAIIYKPLLKINNTELAIQIDTNVSHLELNGKEKSHLYLILKEIINNAMKYSQATELSININKGKSRLLLTIADNGIGIQNDHKGYGLKNIEQRAKEIKYSIKTTSNAEGTTFILEK